MIVWDIKMKLVRCNKKNITFFCLLIALILPFFLRLTGVVTFLSSALSIIVLSVLLTFVWLININKIMKVGYIILLLCNLAMLVINLRLNGSFGVVITFYYVSISLMIFNNISITLKQVGFIRLVTATLLILLVLSFSYEWQYDLIWVYDRDVLINTNTYAILWLLIYFNLCCYIELADLKISAKKIIFFIITVISFLMIWIAKCRSALLAAIFFLVFYLYKKLHYKKTLLLLVLLGVIFPVAYIWIYNTFGNIEFLGKSLFSGRQHVWNEVWKTIEISPIIGTGTVYKIEWLGHVTDSAHNTYLGFWKTVGLIPLISFVYFMFSGKNTKLNNSKNDIAKKAFLACMIICVVETLLNDSNYNFLFLLLLLNGEERLEGDS